MYAKRIMGVVLACLTSLLFCFAIALALEEVEIEDIEVASGLPYVVGDGGLDIGVVYYMDRDYIVNLMPEELIGATWIMTGNGDKNSAGEEFLKFTVGRNAIVWLARDSRGDEGKGGVIPEWLSEDSGWERHEEMLIDVTDGNMGHFVLYSKEFAKGEVILGGNADPPAAGHGSNYLVLVTPGEDLAVEPAGKLSTTWAGLKNEQ